jgi:hypothetical protein
MPNQTGSAGFPALFESALQEYAKKTGIALPNHPLAIQLQTCDSIESITAIVHGQASCLTESLEKERIMKSIKSTLSILNTLFATADLGDTIGLVRQKVAYGVFHISDGFTVIPSDESNTRWPCCFTCRMRPVAVPTRASS